MGRAAARPLRRGCLETLQAVNGPRNYNAAASFPVRSPHPCHFDSDD